MNESQIIEVKNLKKGFGLQKVINNVSLQLFKGENLVVLGKSGSGKSVLIKCIVRLLTPDEGEINVLGENVGQFKQGCSWRDEKKNWFSFSKRSTVRFDDS